MPNLIVFGAKISRLVKSSIATNGLGLANVGGFEIQMFKLSTNVK
jgi:hypothetical protein